MQFGKGLGECVVSLPQREHDRALSFQLLARGVLELELQPAGRTRERAANGCVGVAPVEQGLDDDLSHPLVALELYGDVDVVRLGRAPCEAPEQPHLPDQVQRPFMVVVKPVEHPLDQFNGSRSLHV